MAATIVPYSRFNEIRDRLARVRAEIAVPDARLPVVLEATVVTPRDAAPATPAEVVGAAGPDVNVRNRS